MTGLLFKSNKHSVPTLWKQGWLTWLQKVPQL